ncbi:hypothetical protein KHQ81_03760 [Mycoplasmatota bacterium]|nr:hypothetical protein KHQ81_03760 [Mycoplasmatota bacterium]
MLKKVYSFTYELLNGLKLIGFATLYFYIASIESESNYKVVSYIIGTIFSVFSIMFIYKLYKKIHKKKSYLVEKKNINEWVFNLFGNTLFLGLLIFLMVNIKNNPIQHYFIVFIILVSINLLFIFLNRFLGTKKEDKLKDDLSNEKTNIN